MALGNLFVFGEGHNAAKCSTEQSLETVSHDVLFCLFRFFSACSLFAFSGVGILLFLFLSGRFVAMA